VDIGYVDGWHQALKLKALIATFNGCLATATATLLVEKEESAMKGQDEIFKVTEAGLNF
jgi:hypothetical protein